jgi:hypothetical protein
VITNVELLVEYLAKWTAEYTKKNGKQLLVLVHSDNRRDTFTNYICSHATKFHSGLRFTAIKNHDANESVLKYIDAYTIASQKNGIIIGSIDKGSGLYSRIYKKIEYGFMDICPLFDLEYTDIIQATLELFPSRTDWSDNESTEIHRMLEFCNHMEKLYGIITADELPHKHSRWPFLLKQQKDWVAKIHQREKWTRHKKMMKPFPEIPKHICTGPAR